MKFCNLYSWYKFYCIVLYYNVANVANLCNRLFIGMPFVHFGGKPNLLTSWEDEIAFSILRDNNITKRFPQPGCSFCFPQLLVSNQFLFCFRAPPMISLLQQTVWLGQISRYQFDWKTLRREKWAILKSSNISSQIGSERGGAGASEGGVEGRAEEDGGGDLDLEAGAHCQGAPCSR